MFYTPLPFEDVWGPLQDSALDPLELVDLGRVCLLVRREPDGRRRIERLLSTDPQHLLASRYQPGTVY